MAELPEFERRVTADTMNVPNWGEQFRSFAAETNTLSNIGSSVAQYASENIATKMGIEAGKTPKGDIMPPITSFDKTFKQTYETQAQSTLSLQANKLMTDTALQLDSAYRLTPDLIANANKQVTEGLQQIIGNAPSSIKPNLEYQFGAMQNRQTYQYQNEMLRQQREDQKNNLIAALRTNSEQAYALARHGDDDAAKHVANQSANMANNGVATNLIDPDHANVSTKTIQQAAINGRYVRLAEQAMQGGYYDEFTKGLAQKKPNELTDEQYDGVVTAVSQYGNNYRAMTRQSDLIAATKFKQAIVTNVTGITGDMIADLKATVQPSVFEEMHLQYLNALKSERKSQGEAIDVLAGAGDPEVIARAEPKAVNKAFYQAVDGYIQNQGQKGVAVNRDEAEAAIATQFAAPVPAYVKTIQNKLTSSNPEYLESAGKTIEYLKKANRGDIIASIGDQPIAMNEMYRALRNVVADPVEAAQKAHTAIYDQGIERMQINKQKWQNLYEINVLKAGQTDQSFIFGEADINASNIRNPSSVAGSLLAAYKNYYLLTDGNRDVAKKMLQDDVQRTLGNTYINGRKEYVYMPIEKVLNLPEDAAGFVMEDASSQLNSIFAKDKEAYDKGKIDTYMELVPRQTADDMLTRKKPEPTTLAEAMFDTVKSDYSKPVEVIKHQRNAEPEKYTIEFQADPWLSRTNDPARPIAGGWDIVFRNEKGVRSFPQVLPWHGQITYNPNVKWIKENYNKVNRIKA